MHHLDKILYLVLGVAIGFTISGLTIAVNAQSTYCDRELWIYLFNNNLESLIDCVNTPDIQQDLDIERLDNRTRLLEQRIGLNNTEVSR